MSIALIDYGLGNLLSVYHALEASGGVVELCSHPADLRDAERIVLPGVGAFCEGMQNLHQRGFVEALNEEVIGKGKPVLGICLGMQLMAARGTEGGLYEGLGWVDADVVRLTPDDSSLRIPHIGWNNVTSREDSPLFVGLPAFPDFYFVHSYYIKCTDDKTVDATFQYGGEFTAAIRQNNIFAVQFHPEKSQDYGLRVLENFLRWSPKSC